MTHWQDNATILPHEGLKIQKGSHNLRMLRTLHDEPGPKPTAVIVKHVLHKAFYYAQEFDDSALDKILVFLEGRAHSCWIQLIRARVGC